MPSGRGQWLSSVKNDLRKKHNDAENPNWQDVIEPTRDIALTLTRSIIAEAFRSTKGGNERTAEDVYD